MLDAGASADNLLRSSHSIFSGAVSSFQLHGEQAWDAWFA